MGVGIVTDDGKILANIRDTYITPPGSGFLPKHTAVHHRDVVLKVLEKAMKEAKVTRDQIDAIAFTKGKKFDIRTNEEE